MHTENFKMKFPSRKDKVKPWPVIGDNIPHEVWQNGTMDSENNFGPSYHEYFCSTHLSGMYRVLDICAFLKDVACYIFKKAALLIFFSSLMYG